MTLLTDEEFIELILDESVPFEKKLKHVEGREALLSSILESTRTILKNDGYHVNNGYIFDRDGRIVLIKK